MPLKMKEDEVKVKSLSDGASRGNPGPSAIAFMILAENGKILKRYSKYVGIRTNNQAEYEALISALAFASKLTSQEVVCYMDSELVVKHLNGEYQVKKSKTENLVAESERARAKFSENIFHARSENRKVYRRSGFAG